MSFRAETGSWTLPPRNPNLIDVPDTKASNTKPADDISKEAEDSRGKDNAAFEFVEVHQNSDTLAVPKEAVGSKKPVIIEV